MAQLVISAAGAAVGFMAGGFTGAQIGWAIGSAVGSSFAPAKKVQGAQQEIGDLRVTGSEYGQTIPFVQGMVGLAGQMWWNTDRRPITTTTTTTSGGGGGKGGGGGGAVETSTSSVTYDMDMLIGLTDNQIIGVRRIWNNGKLIFTAASDATAGSLDASASTGLWDRLTVYTGADDQLPDPTYEAAVGIGNAPAYRGRGSVFIQGLKLGASGQIPNLTFEVVTAGAIALNEWIAQAPTIPPRDSWNGVVFANDLFVAVTQPTPAEGSATNNVMTSPDGVTWTTRPHPLSTTLFKKIAYGNGQFVAVGNYGVEGDPVAMTSSDGITWVLRATPIDNAPNDVAFGNGIFVTISATAYQRSMTSTYGATWVEHDMGDTYLNGWKSIAFGNGVFVAVGGQGGAGSNRAARSSNGSLWTFSSLPVLGSWNMVAFGDGLFVAVNKGDTTDGVATSPDGITWTLRTTPLTKCFAVVLAARKIIVLVNQTPSNSMVSDDGGATWAVGETGFPTNDVRDIVYANNTLVVVGRATIGGVAGGMSAFFYPFSLTTVAAAPPSVSSAVSVFCLRAGLSSGQFDVTALSTITRKVRSLAVSQINATRAILEILMSAFFFEIVVSDKIYFRPRGGAPVAAIPFLHLGADASDGKAEPLALLENNELEVPAQIALTYINIDDDYQSDTQYSDRLISAAAGTVSAVNLAIGLTPAEAKAVADTMLLDQAASILSTKLNLLGDYCRLEPTDPVTVTGPDGTAFRLRLVKKTDSYPLLEFEAVIDDTSVLSSQGITSADYAGSTVVVGVADTAMELMDIPILNDADDNAGLYVAAKTADATKTWHGAAIFNSPDDIEYTRRATVSENAVFGTCLTTLGAWAGSRVFDEMNSVQVNVGDGALYSTTRDAVLGNAATNAMLIGQELIQFRTATLVSAGVYTLSGLLRGGRGTEWAMAGHVADERCVLLRTAGLRRILMGNSEIGLSRFYKGVTIGAALSSATAVPFTDNAIGLKPFSPFDLRAARDGSNNVTLTWQRRTRLATRTIGTLGISVPLGEDTEAYDLEIYSDGSYATVVRTITALTLTATYSAAEQTADGFTPGNPIYAKVYQRSAAVGRGYPLEQAA